MGSKERLQGRGGEDGRERERGWGADERIGGKKGGPDEGVGGRVRAAHVLLLGPAAAAAFALVLALLLLLLAPVRPLPIRRTPHAPLVAPPGCRGLPSRRLRGRPDPALSPPLAGDRTSRKAPRHRSRQEKAVRAVLTRTNGGDDGEGPHRPPGPRVPTGAAPRGLRGGGSPLAEGLLLGKAPRGQGQSGRGIQARRDSWRARRAGRRAALSHAGATPRARRSAPGGRSGGAGAAAGGTRGGRAGTLTRFPSPLCFPERPLPEGSPSPRPASSPSRSLPAESLESEEASACCAGEPMGRSQRVTDRQPWLGSQRLLRDEIPQGRRRRAASLSGPRLSSAEARA